MANELAIGHNARAQSHVQHTQGAPEAHPAQSAPAGYGLSSGRKPSSDPEQHAFTTPTPAARLLERFGLTPAALGAGLGPGPGATASPSAARTPVPPPPGKETPWTPNGPNNTHVPYLRAKLNPIFADLVDPSLAKPARAPAGSVGAAAGPAWRPGGGGAAAKAAARRAGGGFGATGGGYTSRAATTTAARARATSRQTSGTVAAAGAGAAAGVVESNSASRIGGHISRQVVADGAIASTYSRSHAGASSVGAVSSRSGMDSTPRAPLRGAPFDASPGRPSSATTTRMGRAPEATAGYLNPAATESARKLSYAEWAQTQVRGPPDSRPEWRSPRARGASTSPDPRSRLRGADGGQVPVPTETVAMPVPTAAAASSHAQPRASSPADTGTGYAAARDGTASGRACAAQGAGTSGLAVRDSVARKRLAPGPSTSGSGSGHSQPGVALRGAGEPPAGPGSNNSGSHEFEEPQLYSTASAVDGWLRPGEQRGQRSRANSGAAAAAAAAVSASGPSGSGGNGSTGAPATGTNAAAAWAGLLQASPPRSTSPSLPLAQLRFEGNGRSLNHFATDGVGQASTPEVTQQSDAQRPYLARSHLVNGQGQLGLGPFAGAAASAAAAAAAGSGPDASCGQSPPREPRQQQHRYTGDEARAAGHVYSTGDFAPASVRSPAHTVYNRLYSDTGSAADELAYDDPETDRSSVLQDDVVRQASMPGIARQASVSGPSWQSGTRSGAGAAAAPANQQLRQFLRSASARSPARNGASAGGSACEQPHGSRTTALSAQARAGSAHGAHTANSSPGERERGSAGARIAAALAAAFGVAYQPPAPPAAGGPAEAHGPAAAGLRPHSVPAADAGVRSHGLGLDSEWVLEEAEEQTDALGSDARSRAPAAAAAQSSSSDAGNAGKGPAPLSGPGSGPASGQPTELRPLSVGPGSLRLQRLLPDGTAFHPPPSHGPNGLVARSLFSEGSSRPPPKPPLPSSRFRSPTGTGDGAPSEGQAQPPRAPLAADASGCMGGRDGSLRQSSSSPVLRLDTAQIAAAAAAAAAVEGSPSRNAAGGAVGGAAALQLRGTVPRRSSNGLIRASGAAVRCSVARHASRTTLGASLLSSVLLGAGAAAAAGEGGAAALRGSIGGASNFSALSGPQADVLYRYPSHGYIERAAEFGRWEAAMLYDLNLYDSLQVLGQATADEYDDPTYSAPAGPAPSPVQAQAQAQAHPPSGGSPAAGARNAATAGAQHAAAAQGARTPASPAVATEAAEAAADRAASGASGPGAAANGGISPPAAAMSQMGPLQCQLSDGGRSPGSIMPAVQHNPKAAAGALPESAGSGAASLPPAAAAAAAAAAPPSPQPALSTGRLPPGALSPVRPATATGLSPAPAAAAAGGGEMFAGTLAQELRRPTGGSMLELLDQLLHEASAPSSRFNSRAGTGDGAPGTAGEGLATAVTAALDNPGGAVSSGGLLRRLSVAAAAAAGLQGRAGRAGAHERAARPAASESSHQSPPRYAPSRPSLSTESPGRVPDWPRPGVPAGQPPSAAQRPPSPAPADSTASHSRDDGQEAQPAGGPPRTTSPALDATQRGNEAKAQAQAGRYAEHTSRETLQEQQQQPAPSLVQQRLPRAPPTVPEEPVAHPLPAGSLLSPSSSAAGSALTTGPPFRQSQRFHQQHFAPPLGPPPPQQHQPSPQEASLAGGSPIGGVPGSYSAPWPVLATPVPPWAMGWAASAPPPGGVLGVAGPYVPPGLVSATVAWWESGRRGTAPAAHPLHWGPGGGSPVDSSAGSGAVRGQADSAGPPHAGTIPGCSASGEAAGSTSSGAATLAAMPHGTTGTSTPLPPPPPMSTLPYISPAGWLPPTPVSPLNTAHGRAWGGADAAPLPPPSPALQHQQAWHEDFSDFSPGYGWHAPPWHLQSSPPHLRPSCQPRAPTSFPPPRLEAIQQLLETDLPTPAIAAAVAVLAGCLPQPWPHSSPAGFAATAPHPSPRNLRAAGASPAAAHITTGAVPPGAAAQSAAGEGQASFPIVLMAGHSPVAQATAHSRTDGAAVTPETLAAVVVAAAVTGQTPQDVAAPGSANGTLLGPVPTQSVSAQRGAPDEGRALGRGSVGVSVSASRSLGTRRSHAALLALAGERGMPPKPLQEEADAGGRRAPPLLGCGPQAGQQEQLGRQRRDVGTHTRSLQGDLGEARCPGCAAGLAAVATVPEPVERPLVRAMRLIAQSLLIVLAGAAGATAAASPLGAVLVRPEDLPCEGCTSITYGKRTSPSVKWAARQLPF